MKASDYIVEYLIAHNVQHVFGYPGGSAAHLIDSLAKNDGRIQTHISYHEQGAAMEACGYAQAGGGVGVAYATSGPGATNLITGICHAFFDSIPVVFITGQINSYELKNTLPVRQRGFQETDIVSIVKSITKYAVTLKSEKDLRYELDRAFYEATTGRKGPVLVDIPMDIQRMDIDPDELRAYHAIQTTNDAVAGLAEFFECFSGSKRPVFLFGNGIKQAGATDLARDVMQHARIPVLVSMLAADLPGDSAYSFGFIGAYGSRAANFIAAKADLVITVGSRMDVRQVGAHRESFAPNARIARFDIDAGELSYKVHCDDLCIQLDAFAALETINQAVSAFPTCYSEWLGICALIQEKLRGMDNMPWTNLISQISDHVPEDALITTDVGQNQVWVAQAFRFKNTQSLHTSGGHGAMGFSLPGAIGGYIATGRPTYSFNGDGGLQMNLQELEFIVREKLPIKIIVLNNHALGMIRHFQEMYFSSRYYQTVESGGYSAPSFKKIAQAYGIDYHLLTESTQDYGELLTPKPGLFEADFSQNTYVVPKLEFGKPNQDQEPLMPRELYHELSLL